MLEDSIWNAIQGEGSQLHYACVEKRLGRPLNLEDFNGCSLNQSALRSMTQHRNYHKEDLKRFRYVPKFLRKLITAPLICVEI